MVVPFGSTAIAPTSSIRRTLDEQDASYVKSYKQNAPKIDTLGVKPVLFKRHHFNGGNTLNGRKYLSVTIFLKKFPFGAESVIAQASSDGWYWTIKLLGLKEY